MAHGKKRHVEQPTHSPAHSTTASVVIGPLLRTCASTSCLVSFIGEAAMVPLACHTRPRNRSAPPPPPVCHTNNTQAHVKTHTTGGDGGGNDR